MIGPGFGEAIAGEMVRRALPWLLGLAAALVGLGFVLGVLSA